MEDGKKAILSSLGILLFGGIYVIVYICSSYYEHLPTLITAAVSTFSVFVLFILVWKFEIDDVECGISLFAIFGIASIVMSIGCNIYLLTNAEDMLSVHTMDVNEFSQVVAVEPSIFLKALILAPAIANTGAIFWLAFTAYNADYGDVTFLQWTPLAYVIAYGVSLLLVGVFAAATATIIAAVLTGILAVVAAVFIYKYFYDR